MANDLYKKTFSNNLKYYMDKNNKNQMDLMKDLNLSSSTVSNWCTGLKLPRMDKIQMLADYFGISKSDLLEEANTEDDSEKEMMRIIEHYKNSPKHRELFENIPDIAEENLDLIIEMVKKLKK